MYQVNDVEQATGRSGGQAAEAAAVADDTGENDGATRILIVDDEEEILDEIHEYLSAKGFDCVTACDGADAIEKFSGDPDISVVLSDIRMPRMDGLAMLGRLSDEFSDNRVFEVLILTGHAGRDEAIDALQKGAMDFLTKPVSLKHLAHSTRNALNLVRAKRMEQRHLQNLEVALEEQKRLNRLQREFVSMVSHEFRTPLAIIDGAAQRMIRRKDQITPEDLEKRAHKVRNAVVRMTDLIESTLYASRLDAGAVQCSMAQMDVRDLVNTICDRQDEISPHHEIVRDLDRLPPAVTADVKLIDKVFTNLLSNAVKYAPGSPRIEVLGWGDDSWAAVSVRDFGVGIPKDEMQRLFGRYFRASTSTGIPGTGIGLHICKNFVEMHGGTVQVESTEGQGTTFTVFLPINPPPPPAEQQTGT